LLAAQFFYLILLLFLPPLSTRSPLSPYTTLFRSPVARLSHPSRSLVVDCHPAFRSRPGTFDRLSPRVPAHIRHQFLPLWRAARQDRKSTRLNSSHGSISYAVFCLKKKKHIQSIDL